MEGRSLGEHEELLVFLLQTASPLFSSPLYLCNFKKWSAHTIPLSLCSLPSHSLTTVHEKLAFSIFYRFLFFCAWFQHLKWENLLIFASHITKCLDNQRVIKIFLSGIYAT